MVVARLDFLCNGRTKPIVGTIIIREKRACCCVEKLKITFAENEFFWMYLHMSRVTDHIEHF